MRVSRSKTLLLASLLAVFPTGRPAARGILPPTASSEAPAEADTSRLLAGQGVPETFSGIDADGRARTLLSFKSTLDALVVAVIEPSCPSNMEVWTDLRRTFERYNGWRTAFVVVHVGPPDEAGALTKALERRKLPIPVLSVQDDRVVRRLLLERAPHYLVIDESAVLRYRGPARSAGSTKNYLDQALDTVISHLEPVESPERPVLAGCAL